MRERYLLEEPYCTLLSVLRNNRWLGYLKVDERFGNDQEEQYKERINIFSCYRGDHSRLPLDRPCNERRFEVRGG